MSLLVFVAIGYMVCGHASAPSLAPYSCCACFVAGEPGGGCLALSRTGAPPGGRRGGAERRGVGQGRVCSGGRLWGMRYPGDSQNVAVGTIAHQFDERITPSQQNNSDGHK